MIRLDSWWRSITSSRIALILLILLMVIVVLGSLFPALSPDIASNTDLRESFLQATQDKYGLRAELYHALGLFGMYRSRWFWILLSGTALLTLACVLNRLRSRHLAAIVRSGSFLVHLGAVLLIAGAGWSTWGSWRLDDIPLLPGQAVEPIPSWPHGLRCDAFEVTFYPSGQPQDYRATVSVTTDNKDVFTHDLRVNHPLYYDGVGIYLKSYGTTPTIKAIGADNTPLTMQSNTGDKSNGDLTLLMGQGETYEIDVPELDITLRLAASSRAEEVPQGGYFVEAIDRSAEIIAMGLVLPGKEFEIEKATFSLTQDRYVIIQAVRDLGFWPAILGATAIFLGIALSLFAQRGRVERKRQDG